MSRVAALCPATSQTAGAPDPVRWECPRSPARWSHPCQVREFGDSGCGRSHGKAPHVGPCNSNHRRGCAGPRLLLERRLPPETGGSSDLQGQVSPRTRRQKSERGAASKAAEACQACRHGGETQTGFLTPGRKARPSELPLGRYHFRHQTEWPRQRWRFVAQHSRRTCRGSDQFPLPLESPVEPPRYCHSPRARPRSVALFFFSSMFVLSSPT
mmetsp:Transcript_14147/g.41647  ORF Transcript_14147/g.41647 Transcript_14147/m.41647 type:complete len:213 (+) Transcript_14147:2130-2768(+)